MVLTGIGSMPNPLECGAPEWAWGISTFHSSVLGSSASSSTEGWPEAGSLTALSPFPLLYRGADPSEAPGRIQGRDPLKPTVQGPGQGGRPLLVMSDSGHAAGGPACS